MAQTTFPVMLPSCWMSTRGWTAWKRKQLKEENIRLVAEHRELLAGQIRIVITSYTNVD